MLISMEISIGDIVSSMREHLLSPSLELMEPIDSGHTSSRENGTSIKNCLVHTRMDGLDQQRDFNDNKTKVLSNRCRTYSLNSEVSFKQISLLK